MIWACSARNVHKLLLQNVAFSPPRWSDMHSHSHFKRISKPEWISHPHNLVHKLKSYSLSSRIKLRNCMSCCMYIAYFLFWDLSKRSGIKRILTRHINLARIINGCPRETVCVCKKGSYVLYQHSRCTCLCGSECVFINVPACIAYGTQNCM